MPDAVGIVCHPRIDIGGPPVMEARRRLEARGFRVWTYCATAEERPGALAGDLNGTRLIVSVGGDGTLLWTAQQARQFEADGVIVSTPTGSTGYALSLGGPIVHPDVRAITFMPLNPHSLFNRPIVLPEQARITLRLPSASAILTCDGQQNADLAPGAEVRIAAPGLAVELVQFDRGPNFFELLRRKLRWGLPLVDGDE